MEATRIGRFGRSAPCAPRPYSSRRISATSSRSGAYLSLAADRDGEYDTGGPGEAVNRAPAPAAETSAGEEPTGVAPVEAAEGTAAGEPPAHGPSAGEVHAGEVPVGGARGEAADADADVMAAGIRALRGATAMLAAIDVDGRDDRAIETHAAALQQQIDRLTTRRDLLVGILQRRAVARSRPGREQRATQQVTRRIAETFELTPSEAKRASEAGKVLTDDPDLAGAARDGDLRPEQATLIGRLLRDVPTEHQAVLRAELLAAASELDAVQLGRLGRRRLSQLDQDAAVEAERRRYRQRRAAVTQTADGTVQLSATLAGLDAEVACTAIDAFRTPDPSDGPGRTAEQRTADALTAALRASLDLGTAPANRRVRPHVLITVPAETIVGEDPSGTAEAAWTGPHPVRTVRHLLDDATRQLLGIDHDGLPIALSHATEQPTAALYLALAHRDGGCRWPGCDAPATWCDIAHATARRHQGPVTIANTLLMCRRHHRLVDGGWAITMAGGEAVFVHPSGRRVDARPVNRDVATAQTGRRARREPSDRDAQDPDPPDRGPERLEPPGRDPQPLGTAGGNAHAAHPPDGATRDAGRTAPKPDDDDAPPDREPRGTGRQDHGSPGGTASTTDRTSGDVPSPQLPLTEP